MQTEITGLFQYLLWGLATPTASAGLVSGGDLSTDPDMRRRRGIGGQSVRRGGLVKIGGNATVYVSPTNSDLIAAAFRASYPRGVLTEVFLAGGANDWGREYDNAVITEFGLDYAQGEGLKAALTWGGLVPLDCGGDSMADEPEQDFEDYEFVCQFEGNEYGVLAASIRGSNNVIFGSNADTAAGGTHRWPKFYIYGEEDLTLDLTCGRPLPIGTLNLWQDDLPTDLGLTLIGNNPSWTVTMTLTDLAPNPEGFAFVDSNTQAEWKYGFTGNSKAGSLAYSLV